MRFDNQTAIVTGAASGMGRATARLMAERGAAVVINDVNEKGLATVADEIRDAGGQVLAIPGSIGDRAFVAEATAQAVHDFGRVDMLFNVAGYAAYGPAESYDVWDEMVGVNMSGTYYFCREVARQSMIPNRKGAIVNVSSLSGLVAHPNDIGYIAAKHGVVGITKSLAVEWARHNIRVNCICPGFTMTGIFEAVTKEEPDRFALRARKTPLGRGADPREQATVMAFLASDEASYVTGVIMPVDGGNMALSSGWFPPEVFPANG